MFVTFCTTNPEFAVVFALTFNTSPFVLRGEQVKH
jgi:hypothetical protein